MAHPEGGAATAELEIQIEGGARHRVTLSPEAARMACALLDEIAPRAERDMHWA